MAKLILATPTSAARLLTVTAAATTIGRDAVNDVVIESTLVSRRHAVLLSDGPFVTIKDEGSRNGTYVNGRRVETQVLADHDLIEIGDCVMRFLAAGQEDVAPETLSLMANVVFRRTSAPSPRNLERPQNGGAASPLS